MDTIFVLLCIIGVMFLFDCGVIIYLVTLLVAMKKDKKENTSNK